MICGQVCEPLNWNVPLSCVPPWSRFVGCCADADRLWNCKVESPRLRLVRSVGTRARRLLHFARSAALRPRELQAADPSVLCPLARTTPPSEPSSHWYGLLGLVTRKCWSGWSESLVPSPLPASRDWSLHVLPASSESTTPRPFEASPTS